MNIGRFYRETILFISSVDITDLRSVVSTEIPLLAGLKIGPPIVSAMSLPNFPKFNPQNLIAGDSKPLVGIYHTHTSESFIPSSGVSHTRGGQKGEIVEIGAAMKKHLETNGIQAIHSENVHDYPSFMKAYGASEITAKKMLEENPSIQMLFDIHRDAEKRDNATVMVNGLPTAKILIVVATGQPDLVQPNWQQNHAFAKLIDAKLNAHFPGLSRGIQLVDWRFNQQLHPRALLFEIGCQENSKEEAQKSAELLSDVIAEIIAENKGQ
jgi:stage II sporulation protein P